jgi:pseudouridine-5'-phosphate glycosidase
MSLQIAAEVAAAVAAGRPVVALESTLIAHGLPKPIGAEVAADLEQIVREQTAVPATVAVIAGVPTVGLSVAERDAVAGRDDVVKVSARDLAALVAVGGWGATTVAATSYLADRAGVSVFATGGLGGVHRLAAKTFDESADLMMLSRVPMVVVCSGVKSILDVSATLERLETLNVAVVGFGTDRFPGFYLADSGHPVTPVSSAADIAAIVAERRHLGQPEALVVAQPVPDEHAMDPETHDAVLADGLAAAAAAGVTGKAVTPFLLDHFHRATDGASLRANVALVRSNAALAGRIAVALANR